MERLRRYRENEAVRERYAEVSVITDDLIYPYFLIEGKNQKQEIKSLHGVFRFSTDTLLKDIEETQSLGIRNILLFGVVDDILKDEIGTAAWSDNNLISKVITDIKKYFPGITIFTDVCLCGYTSHGHCGLLSGQNIDNDATLPYLGRMAVQHAMAGADFVAPSAMMDGQVEAIRQQLVKYKLNTKILSYSA